MRKDPDRSQLEGRSARLVKTRRRIDIGDQSGSSRIPRMHSTSGSEEQVVVGQVDVVVISNPNRPNLVEPEEEVAMGGKRVE